MLEQVKLLTRRRGYEFRPDELRISMLSTKPVQEQIQQLFQFQTAMMGTPIATFGDVPVTYPPGFVFDMGVWISQDKQIIPIRFLHFEQSRIVIDVAGPSSAITAIFLQIRTFFSKLKIPNCKTIVAVAKAVLYFNPITCKF